VFIVEVELEASVEFGDVDGNTMELPVTVFVALEVLEVDDTGVVPVPAEVAKLVDVADVEAFDVVDGVGVVEAVVTGVVVLDVADVGTVDVVVVVGVVVVVVGAVVVGTDVKFA